ncbi:hypothetical protein WG901_21905 [Novosphingobium sp. PS1R-30]|uniref:DUF6894 domain-containing protein n=1 Tax=Novosphingobium anseongense TaxID=3133436 RepID=A0ABU8S2Y0_9SPHN
MQRYFLHLHNDINAPDEEGQEFPDDRAALECALASARDVASSAVRTGSLNLNHFIICVADDGREVGIVRFGDAVRVVAISAG